MTEVTQPPAIVTDSTCDLPAGAAEEYNIQVMPLKLNFGDESFRSGVEMTRDQVLARIAQGGPHPTTSPPDVADFRARYEALSAGGRRILSIHLSSGLGGTFGAAQQAARDLPVTVWDSKMVSGALGLQVLTAARAARAGCSVEEIIPLLKQTYDQSQFLFCLDDLLFLNRGGRIGKVSYYVAQTLRLKPVITVSKEGDTIGTHVPTIDRPHSLSGALDVFLRHAHRNAGKHGTLRAIISFCCDESAELVDRLVTRLKEEFQCVLLETTPASPTLVIHTGPKSIAIGYAKDDWPV